jgi:hypothetical protein
MLIVIIIISIGLVVSFGIAFLTTSLIRKRDRLTQDEPFELTEISNTTPTPTPVYEKKKRGRKPKTTK